MSGWLLGGLIAALIISTTWAVTATFAVQYHKADARYWRDVAKGLHKLSDVSHD